MTKIDNRINARPCPMPCLASGGSEACPLLEAARSAAQTINETEVRPVSEPGFERLLEPRTLLAAVSYCYARHTFGSAMLNLWAKDANLRELCSNVTPGPEVLARFCKENRASIEQCLANTLGLIADKRMAQGYLARVNKAQLAEEAHRRLVMAAFVENTEDATNASFEMTHCVQHPAKEAVDDNAETVLCYAS